MMDATMDWIYSLSAAVGGTILMCQFIATVAGLERRTGAPSRPGIAIPRPLAAGLVGFGLTGLVAASGEVSPIWSLFAGLCGGTVATIGLSLMIRTMRRVHDDALRIEPVVVPGENGDVGGTPSADAIPPPLETASLNAVKDSSPDE